MRIDLEEGVWTTMLLYLPRLSGVLPHDQVQNPVERSLQLPARSSTVLLVEDETAIRVLMSELLAEAGDRVIETAEGSAAVERLRSHKAIDVLVTDVRLTGGLNGRQVADAGRQYRPSPPVLF